MLIARSRAELDAHRAALLAKGGALALVPTMGALHEGHLALLAAARATGAIVAASIFVNPLQFAPNEDFARYPRDEAGDLRRLRDAGCALAWLPDLAAMYPARDATVIEVAGPACDWEGRARPGHFRGVATVVAKLLGQVRPDIALFGEKDWQQLQVIRRMAHDLALSPRIVGVPTVREADGLALSSRNRFLDPVARGRAPMLHAALLGIVAGLGRGADAASCIAAASANLAGGSFEIDYLALVDGETLEPLGTPRHGARLIAAARLGGVRLLDNIAAG